MRLKDKVAIITGAGQGIGQATAMKFAREGARVAVCDINRASVDDTVATIVANGGEALGYTIDVTDKASIAKMVEGVMGAWGRIDTLVNNAGIVQDAQFRKMTDDQFERVIDVNLKGVYNVTKAVVDIMIEQNSGCILNASSIVGIYGNFGQTNYAAAKLGIVGLTNVMKLEGAKYNIRTNVIAPVAASRLTEDVLPPQLFEKMKPDFITPLVLYLASEQCTDTGMIINCTLGYYSRSAIVTGPGAFLSDGHKIPEPEEIMAAWDKIKSLENPKYFDQLPEMFGVLGPLLQ